MNKADETANIGFALTDLLSELGVDSSENEKTIQNRMDELNQVYSKAQDLDYLNSDIRSSLEYDLKHGKSITQKLSALRNAIRASKQIATIMGFRPKAAENATRIQEIKINSMILEELQAIHTEQYLAYLENSEAKQKREIFLAELLQNSKGNYKVGHIQLYPKPRTKK